MSKTPTPQEALEWAERSAKHGFLGNIPEVQVLAAAYRAALAEIEQLRSRVQTCVECGGTLIWGPVVDQFARAEKAEAALAAVKVERDGYLTDCRTWAKEVDKLRESLARAEKVVEAARHVDSSDPHGDMKTSFALISLTGALAAYDAARAKETRP